MQIKVISLQLIKINGKKKSLDNFLYVFTYMYMSLYLYVYLYVIYLYIFTYECVSISLTMYFELWKLFLLFG